MKFPRLVIHEPDGRAARLLRELAGENRWLVEEPRKSDTALSLARDGRPAVLVVGFDPAAETAAPFALIADAHRFAPDVPVVAVSEAKMNDADRVAWSAVLLDLGARYVLFPPVTKPVIEDVVSGLIASAIRRVIGTDPPPAPRPADGVIDLTGQESDG